MAEPLLINGVPHYKAADAAQRARVGVSRFHQLVRNGRIPYVVHPHGKLYADKDLDRLRTELDAWPERRRKRTTQEEEAVA
jgi:predicted site-specific integrase-resolvase